MSRVDKDLAKLARSDWPSFAGSADPLLDGSGACYYESPAAGKYRYTQYLQARHVLGLDDTVMTEEEEAMPAEEWDYGAEPDMVNKPPHYQLREGYEVYDLRQDLARKAQAAGVPHDQFSDWDRALEYLLRMWEKNGVEDAKKGAWYVNKLIGKLEVRR